MIGLCVQLFRVLHGRRPIIMTNHLLSRAARGTIPILAVALLTIPFAAALSGTDANNAQPLAGGSEIRSVKVVEVSEHAADLEIEYFYDGSAGVSGNISVELLADDGNFEGQLAGNAGSVREGPGTRRIRIERPMLEVEEFATRRVKVTLEERQSKPSFCSEFSMFRLPGSPSYRPTWKSPWITGAASPVTPCRPGGSLL